jgi:ferredoxin-NADP reductase
MGRVTGGQAGMMAALLLAALLALLFGHRVVQRAWDSRAARRRTAMAMRRRNFWSGELQVLRILPETPDVKTFRLGMPGGGPLPFVHQPGQYLNFALTIAGERVNRSYTIASSPTETRYYDVTVKRSATGHASRYLHDVVSEGAMMKVSGPVGRFVFTGAESDAVVLIAGGVGITPLMAIVRYLTDRSWTGSMYLIFAARTARNVIFFEELRRLESRFPNLHLAVTLSGEDDPSWDGHRGRISAQLLSTFVPGVARLPVYLCGPDAMMLEMRTLLAQLGVPEPQIRTEAFASSVALEPPATSAPATYDRTPTVFEATGGAPTVEFRRSMKVVELSPGQSILEAAEDAGLELPFECRAGTCGQCTVRLLAGSVTMAVEDALSTTDRSRGLVLACQAQSTSSVVVDA